MWLLFRWFQTELARDMGYAAGRFGHVMFPENVYEPALESAELLLEGAGKGWQNVSMCVMHLNSKVLQHSTGPKIDKKKKEFFLNHLYSLHFMFLGFLRLFHSLCLKFFLGK